MGHKHIRVNIASVWAVLPQPYVCIITVQAFLQFEHTGDAIELFTCKSLHGPCDIEDALVFDNPAAR